MRYFISYSRRDLDFVMRLAQDLRANSIDIWLDKLDIEVGQPWDREIEKALQECAGFLYVISPDSVSSENVMDEVSYAIGKDKKIIPIYHRECEVPFRVSRLQRVDFTGEYAASFENLLSSINQSRAYVKSTQDAVLSSPKVSAKKRWSPSVILGIVVLLLSSVGGLYLLVSDEEGIEISAEKAIKTQLSCFTSFGPTTPIRFHPILSTDNATQAFEDFMRSDDPYVFAPDLNGTLIYKRLFESTATEGPAIQLNEANTLTISYLGESNAHLNTLKRENCDNEERGNNSFTSEVALSPTNGTTYSVELDHLNSTGIFIEADGIRQANYEFVCEAPGRYEISLSIPYQKGDHVGQLTLDSDLTVVCPESFTGWRVFHTTVADEYKFEMFGTAQWNGSAYENLLPENISLHP